MLVSFLYADDIVMYKNLDAESSERDIGVFRCDIKTVEKWCFIYELTINIKKTKLQFFLHNCNTDCGQFERYTVCTIYTRELSM